MPRPLPAPSVSAVWLGCVGPVAWGRRAGGGGGGGGGGWVGGWGGGGWGGVVVVVMVVMVMVVAVAVGSGSWTTPSHADAFQDGLIWTDQAVPASADFSARVSLTTFSKRRPSSPETTAPAATPAKAKPIFCGIASRLTAW